MTDIQAAKNGLAEHTVCFCKDGDRIADDKRGISPVMELIEHGVDLNGYSVADKVVGKAAAMLFVKCGIKEVYAKVLSERGKAVLDRFDIPVEYETLTDKIINRTGDGMCPMEKTVWDIEDVEEAYAALKLKLEAMKKA